MITDWELVKKYKGGDNEAIAILLDRYSPRLLKWSFSILRNHEDAKDCVQNINKGFCECSIDKRKGYFNQGEEQVIPYLRSVAHNRALDMLKELNKNFFVDIDSLKNEPLYENESIVKLTKYNDFYLAVCELDVDDFIFTCKWLDNPKEKQKIMLELSLSDSQYRIAYERVKLNIKRNILKVREKNKYKYDEGLFSELDDMIGERRFLRLKKLLEKTFKK